MSVKYDFHTVDGVMLLAEATWDAQKKNTFFFGTFVLKNSNGSALSIFVVLYVFLFWDNIRPAQMEKE